MIQSSPINLRRAILLFARVSLCVICCCSSYATLFLLNFIPWPLFALRFSLSTNLSNFGVHVESYKLLSPGGVFFVSHTLPFAELILGLLLLIGWQLRIWASLITLIMVGFLGVVSRAYLLHMNINCGFFATPEPLTGMTVVRHAAFTALAGLMTTRAFAEARHPPPWSP